MELKVSYSNKYSIKLKHFENIWVTIYVVSY